MNCISYHWLNWQRNAAKSKVIEPVFNDFLSCSLPERGADWRDVEFIAVDLETTGLNPLAHEIASAGWVVIKQGVIKLNSAKHKLVKTQMGVGNSATIHHITDTETSKGETLKTVLTELIHDSTGRVPLFHNACLDLGFINNACLRHFDSQFITPFIDTLQLEKDKVLQHADIIGPGSLRLHACRSRYGLPNAPAHNALEDALATAELFLAWAAHRAGPEKLPWDEAI
ncbi:exonuclease domain-containing protein [Simiduia curdlanivorans]|uniref:Exonuclease domain-containing protein n=1 Tax=Simiduia curdlanivorans TaxID=1492769 RepID=A0ABV8V2Y7_9GAMM|nr:exonuclease domain-containing protein [Simiduia curdlanivorans]MDN3640051.1 exonuclease domain-containing protein [Simiduia curdlanivorans]